MKKSNLKTSKTKNKRIIINGIELIPLKEVMNILGFSRTLIMDLVNQNKITYYRLGVRYFFELDNIMEFLQSNKKQSLMG